MGDEDEQHNGRDGQDSAKHVKVLIVDDDAWFCASMERSLERLGYDVERAADGVEGLAKAIATQPQVILADIQMPRMDGNTLIRELARHSADAVVILISGGHRFDDVFEGLRAGAVHFLMKPWSTEQLVVAMNRARQESERRTRQRLGAEPPV